jgi:hypothetical protein
MMRKPTPANSAPHMAEQHSIHDAAPRKRPHLRDMDREEEQTYRLESLRAVVAILALGAWLGTCTAGGNVWVVGLLAVGHGGSSNEFRG